MGLVKPIVLDNVTSGSRVTPTPPKFGPLAQLVSSNMNFINENIEVLTKLEKELPNNMEFGNAIRRRFMDEEFTRKFPNDQELGKEVRKIIKNI